MTPQRVSSCRSSRISDLTGTRAPVLTTTSAQQRTTAPRLDLCASCARSRAVVIRATGTVDLATAQDLDDLLREQLAAGADVIVLDLSSVDFLAVVGLDVLAAAARLAEEQHVDLRLVAGSHEVAHAIRIGRLHKRVGCYESVSEAVPSLAMTA